MPPLRLICPGAVAAGVAATVLIAAGAKIVAAPLGDGRWQVDADDVPPATVALVGLRVEEPLQVQSAAPAPGAEGGPVPLADVGTITSFRASSVASAKTTAARMAHRIRRVDLRRRGLDRRGRRPCPPRVSGQGDWRDRPRSARGRALVGGLEGREVSYSRRGA